MNLILWYNFAFIENYSMAVFCKLYRAGPQLDLLNILKCHSMPFPKYPIPVHHDNFALIE